MNTTAKVLSGFLAGAAIGTIAGILIAPDKGENTRKKLKDESKHLADDIAGSLSHTLHALTHAYRERGDRGRMEREVENGKLESAKMRV
jgi:gas vesicle protein